MLKKLRIIILSFFLLMQVNQRANAVLPDSSMAFKAIISTMLCTPILLRCLNFKFPTDPSKLVLAPLIYGIGATFLNTDLVHIGLSAGAIVYLSGWPIFESESPVPNKFEILSTKIRDHGESKSIDITFRKNSDIQEKTVSFAVLCKTEDICPVCRDNFSEKMVVQLPCKHEYCSDCLSILIVKNLKSCALCRADFLSSNEKPSG